MCASSAATSQLQLSAVRSSTAVVVACSALKVSYRTVLRERICATQPAVDLRFVLLAVEAAKLRGVLLAPGIPNSSVHYLM